MLMFIMYTYCIVESVVVLLIISDDIALRLCKHFFLVPC